MKLAELVRFSLLTRDRPDLTDRYSKRKEAADSLQERMNLKAAT